MNDKNSFPTLHLDGAGAYELAEQLRAEAARIGEQEALDATEWLAMFVVGRSKTPAPLPTGISHDFAEGLGLLASLGAQRCVEVGMGLQCLVAEGVAL